MKKVLLLLLVVIFSSGLMASHVKVRSLNEKSENKTSNGFVRNNHSHSNEGDCFSPFAISLFPKGGLPSQNYDIVLLRINIFAGSHNNVYGLDFGTIFNEVENNFVGVQCAGFCNKIGYSDGCFQFAGILNRVNGDFVGLQVSSTLNIVEETLNGFQIGLVNKAEKIGGAQLGFYNYTNVGEGCQFGVLNFARDFKGIQIGLCNYNYNSSIVFSPFINCAF